MYERLEIEKKLSLYQQKKELIKSPPGDLLALFEAFFPHRNAERVPLKLWVKIIILGLCARFLLKGVFYARCPTYLGMLMTGDANQNNDLGKFLPNSK